MNWTKPDFEEVSLCMEVTAYVNVEDRPREQPARPEPAPAAERVERDD
jgi:coenzyme PQQ precursor peptide PqqA